MNKFLFFSVYRNTVTKFFTKSLLLIVLLIVTGHVSSQTILVSWNFDDLNNIADTAIMANSSRTINREVLTSLSYT